MPTCVNCKYFFFFLDKISKYFVFLSSLFLSIECFSFIRLLCRSYRQHSPGICYPVSNCKYMPSSCVISTIYLFIFILLLLLLFNFLLILFGLNNGGPNMSTDIFHMLTTFIRLLLSHCLRHDCMYVWLWTFRPFFFCSVISAFYTLHFLSNSQFSAYTIEFICLTFI